MIFKAMISDVFERDGVRLYLRMTDRSGSSYLLEDGSWQTVDDGAAMPLNAGMFLPKLAWEAIVAIAAPHADTGEIKQLHESLTLERSRVEKIIDRHLQ